MKEKLEAIVNYPYKGVKRIDKMTREKRASQFMSFAALVGFKDDIDKKEKISDKDDYS